MGDIANRLGSVKVTNTVSLGVLANVCEGLISKEYLIKAIEKVLGEKKKNFLPMNIEALEAGLNSLAAL